MFGGHARDTLVRVRISPNDVEAVVRISRRVLVSESVDDVRQGIVLPAYQDISRPIVAFHSISNAVRVIAIAVRVDCESEVLRERLYGLIRTGAFAA